MLGVSVSLVLRDRVFRGMEHGRDWAGRSLVLMETRFFFLCSSSILKEVAMFRKVSNSDIFYVATFHHVMISAKIISLKLWPKVKFLCHLNLLEG